MSRPFKPAIAYNPKNATMDLPPFAEHGPVAQGAPGAGAVEGQPDATPLPAEPERHSDAYNVAVVSGATESDPRMSEALGDSADKDAKVLGGAPYDPIANPGDAVREQRHQDRLARLDPLRVAKEAAERETHRTAEALAEEGAEPRRPQARAVLAVATLGLTVPTSVALYPSVALPWLLEPSIATVAAGLGGFLVAAATTWTLAHGLPVDHEDPRQVRLTLVIGSLGMGTAVGLLAATGGSGLVAAGLALLAGLGTAVTILVARQLHLDRRTWEPRHRAWSARHEAWLAAQRDEARAARELATCEAGIAAHEAHLAGRTSALRASELRARAARASAVVGYERGVRANQGVWGWARAPKRRQEQIARYHARRSA